MTASSNFEKRTAKLIAGLLIGAAGFGQTFEVASVKPSPPPKAGARMFFGIRGGPGTPNPGQITSTLPLRDLLMTAYDVQRFQVSGPAWINTERYEIVAKVPPGTTKEQVKMMWRSLLAERFGVVLHHESKEFQVEELVVARGGPKLKESAIDSGEFTPPAGPPKVDKNGFPELNGPGMIHMINMSPNGPIAHTVAKAQALSQLVTMIGNQLNRPVIDKTGLTGKYDFTLEFTPELNGLRLPPQPPGQPPPAAPPENTSEPSGPNLAAALQQQLGLRLVSSRAKLDVLVIDHADKTPTEN